MNPSSPDPAASRDRVLVIDRLCDEFERGWRSGSRPAIESVLALAPPAVRRELAAELILLDVECRRKAGERPTAADYQKRFPFVEARTFAAIADAPRAITLPTTLGEYELTKRLGGGGMGEVFLARHRRMTRLVAVKVLSAGKPDQDEARQRFDRETRITALLSHPNVVTAFDAREDEGIRYLVTEYMPGGDLGRMVRTSGPLTLEAAVTAVRQAALGLAHAHEKGVIHRDVKPGNLLRGANGVVRVADWGLARIQADPTAPDTTDALTDLGSLIGTIDFLAPEQARRPDRVTPAADVYGLGCTLFFLLTGRPPFIGGDHLDRLAAHRSTEPPDLRELRSEIPARLAGCVARMLAKRPGNRHRDMRAVVADLDEVLDPNGGGWSDLGPPPAPRPRVSRRAALAGALAMTGVAAGVGWLIQRGRDRRGADPAAAVTLRELPVEDIGEYQRSWAKRCGVEVEMTDERGIRLVFIPPGTFRMGSPAAAIARFADPRAEPAAQRRDWVTAETERVVTIRRPFFISRTEVTKAEFGVYFEDTKRATRAERFGGGWGYDNASAKWRPGDGFSWRDMGDFRPQPDHPVGNIAWGDAQQFCQWLSESAPPGVRYRLPAESEWEFAARAGGVGLWAHGNDEAELNKYATFGTFTLPRPVASLRPNAFGLFDMAGNLPEWCDPADPWTESRCPPFLQPARGGGFYSPAGHVRVAAFQWIDPNAPDPGIRVVREIPE